MTRPLLPLFACWASVAAQAMQTIAPMSPSVTHLFGRASCPGNTFQCPIELGQVFSDICCENGQTCALDADEQPACCPAGLVCTGTAPTAAPTARPTTAVSYVDNSYFSFPYAESSFDNSRACTSAVSACSENYDACVTNLQGGTGYGVTIVVPGAGGTTVDGGGIGSIPGPSATSICSSLSSEACSDLKATQCSDFGPEDDDSAAVSMYHRAYSSILGCLAAVAWLI